MAGKVKFGILGCADIANKTAMGIAEAPNAEIVAVASRSKEKAEKFLENNAMACAPGAKGYDSYDALLEDAEVQVVYIPLPTTMKKEWVLKCAAKNKHVLCEKPLAGNYEDAREMVQACHTAGVQFMDNTMMMHHERLGKMKEVLSNVEEFGKVKHVVSCFTIPFGNGEDFASNNIRMNKSTEPLGCLGDLGWYNIRTSLWAFAWEEPEAVSCHYFEKTPDGVPITCHAILRYSGGRTATFDNSMKCDLRQWAEVVGEKQSMTWDDLCVTQLKEQASFVVATGGVAERAITFPKEVKISETVHDCVQHTQLVQKMAELVAELVAGGAPDDIWPTLSLQTQKITMLCHDSAQQDGMMLPVPKD